MVLACAGFLFFRVEQSAVQRSILSSTHVSETNQDLRTKNEKLEDAKKKLEKDEDEYVARCRQGLAHCLLLFSTPPPHP